MTQEYYSTFNETLQAHGFEKLASKDIDILNKEAAYIQAFLETCEKSGMTKEAGLREWLVQKTFGKALQTAGRMSSRAATKAESLAAQSKIVNDMVGRGGSFKNPAMKKMMAKRAPILARDAAEAELEAARLASRQAQLQQLGAWDAIKRPFGRLRFRWQSGAMTNNAGLGRLYGMMHPVEARQAINIADKAINAAPSNMLARQKLVGKTMLPMFEANVKNPAAIQRMTRMINKQVSRTPLGRDLAKAEGLIIPPSAAERAAARAGKATNKATTGATGATGAVDTTAAAGASTAGGTVPPGVSSAPTGAGTSATAGAIEAAKKTMNNMPGWAPYALAAGGGYLLGGRGGAGGPNVVVTSVPGGKAAEAESPATPQYAAYNSYLPGAQYNGNGRYIYG